MITLPLETEEAEEEAAEHQAVTSLQRAFRKHLKKKATNEFEGMLVLGGEDILEKQQELVYNELV
jgi:hypothetical protein